MGFSRSLASQGPVSSPSDTKGGAVVDMRKSFLQTAVVAVDRERLQERINLLKRVSASKEEVRALVREVEALTEKGLFGHLLGRVFE